MDGKSRMKASAYDKYINYKRFSIAVALFILILALPIPKSMLDVAVEYTEGGNYALEFYTQELFGKSIDDAEQWQALTAAALEKCMLQGTLSKSAVMKRDFKQLNSMGVKTSQILFDGNVPK